ncbi:hypothetical protein DFR29_108180 [Tahibacter aquaticus]|uniref:Conditioned medium factor n=1 Tax=Tahibacter aquaticus TaxID=520092 RepID=A0A4R6YV98_9GAMM|nr:choice-of-anchor X domain-containing protein [Tahibacter aquaticus]TDR42593.1 hypothetical protein DFR29_108180 [Tahibacter aquaticus]
MTRSPLTLAVVSALLFAAPLVQAATEPVPKQLSGPPEEFAQLRVPAPADAAVFSHSALMPVELNESGNWRGEIPVENGRVRFLTFSPATASDWQLQMTAPSGRQVLSQQLAEAARSTRFGIEQASVPANYYALEGLENGSWQVRVDSAAARAGGGFLLIEGDKRTELMSYPAHRRQIVGQQLDVVATLTSNDGASDTLTPAAARIATAQLRVTAPDGSIKSYPMFDDGQHADGIAGDGVYGAGFRAEMSGNYVAQVQARGANRDGVDVLRTAEHVLPVVDDTLHLSNLESLVEVHATDNGRLSIDVPVVQITRVSQHYRAFAQVWGRDSRGAEAPVAWVSGMVTPAAGKLSLSLDPRWISASKAQGPFELRDLRIEDADHFVTLAGASRMALQMPEKFKAPAAPRTIDEAMTVGPRPAAERISEGVGQRLLLVHGYCSGGVWPASQFSTASSFLDVNQNRSHDQFARLLQTFGSTWNSFGTVAHSQGGAAALHLYTYYWSGLDNATGARLMQSVGTPYKGTNLAGILATLGSWFGVGCGTNDNLSYNGAAAWLAGIPNSRRAKVNYYTTAFRTTNWWTNDYCQIATDLVLSDPEDGTTEQANGQLSGGVNRGHTTGQCHTSGMRDPAQYLDASRNATMNSNAAR